MSNDPVRKLLSIALLICMVLTLTRIGTLDSHAQSQSSTFWIEYLDVGQGDAALVQCDGHYMLVDGGSSRASDILYTVLSKKNITKLDYMIASHPDDDHIGGLSGALNYATVSVCYSPVSEFDSKPFNNLVKYLDRQNKKITVPKAGTKFKLGSAGVSILGPVSSSDDTNNMSIVAKVTYGKNSFLFTGDAESIEEADLIKNKADLSCDVLKVSHHGSADATSEPFLQKAKPKYAVISVGKDNSYGHPTIEVLNRLNDIGADIYRTDLRGDITCTSDGSRITFTTEKMVIEDPRSIRTAEPGAYVLNINTNKFHYPNCGSVSKMKAKNRKDVIATRDELIQQGYSPCGNCHP